jgi:transposase
VRDRLFFVEDGSEPRKAHVRSSQVFRKAQQPDLFTADLDSRIARDSEAWWIGTVLAEMDLDSLLGLYWNRGGIAYEPCQMLGILLLGYMLGVTGSRELEERCRFDHRFIWVAKGLTPDDRTIGRFRRRLAPAMDDLLSAFVDLARRKGMLSLRRVSVDGTKLQSAAGGLAKWLRQAEAQDLACGLELPDCSDPEARLLSTGSGGMVGYNAQVAIDVDSGLVVATAIADSPSDRAQLAPMLEQVQKITGDTPVEMVGDRGYDSAEGLQALEDAGVLAYVAPQDSAPLFWSVVSESEIVCPMGHAPSLLRPGTRNGVPVVKMSVPVCQQCVFFGSCCKSRWGRSMVVPEGVDPVLRVQAAHRAREPEHKLAMKDRLKSVEPFFAQIKSNRGMRRLKLRSKEGAKLELTLMALARNFKVLQNLSQAFICRVWHLFRASRTLTQPRIAA